MPYCTPSDVRTIINTVLTDDQINDIVETSDAEIDKRIGPQGASDKLIKKLSMLLTAHTIKTRQPQSHAIGEYREDAGDIIEVWEREVDRIYKLYKTIIINTSKYEHINESKRYPEA